MIIGGRMRPQYGFIFYIQIIKENPLKVFFSKITWPLRLKSSRCIDLSLFKSGFPAVGWGCTLWLNYLKKGIYKENILRYISQKSYGQKAETCVESPSGSFIKP